MAWRCCESSEACTDKAWCSKTPHTCHRSERSRDCSQAKGFCKSYPRSAQGGVKPCLYRRSRLLRCGMAEGQAIPEGQPFEGKVSDAPGVQASHQCIRCKL